MPGLSVSDSSFLFHIACGFTLFFAAQTVSAQSPADMPPSMPATEQAQSMHKGVPAVRTGPNSKSSDSLIAKPSWSELSAHQQQALSPLATEWDKLNATQKQKWLEISRKYSTLKPDQQIRLQERMRDWVKLSPQERRLARESYSRAKNMNPDQKTAEWEQYQQLPEEQKRKLAAEAAAKNRVANLPPPSQNKSKIVPPKPEQNRKPEPATIAPSGPTTAPVEAVPLQPK